MTTNKTKSSNSQTKSSRLSEVLNASNTKSHPNNPPTAYKMDCDLFTSFRGFLVLGRCLGLIPILGVFKHSYKDLTSSFFSFAGLTSVCCILLLSFNLGLAIMDFTSYRKRTISEFAAFGTTPMFSLWGIFMYSYFLYRRQLLINIFKTWSNCNLKITYTQKDKALKATIIIVSCIMFASTVLENAVLNLEYFVQFDDINGHTIRYGVEEVVNASVLEIYYSRAHPYWSRIIGYNPILLMLAFINHKLALFSGNYIDVMMSLFARALYFKFHALRKVAENALLQPILQIKSLDTHVGTENDRQAWNQLAQDHDYLCEILNAMNAFFSPVIFVSYLINIYFFCMQLLNVFNPAFTQDSIVHSIYTPWSFIHIIVRMFLLSLFMARVNEYAHKTIEIVMQCPVQLYSHQIAKLEKKVTVGSQLGFTGLDCFTVTKPFMLSMLNVVFTIEIVLLQGKESRESVSK